MKKYIFQRLLRSLLSIFLVTTLIYTIIFTMVPRKLVFKNDANYNKVAAKPDEKVNYENTVWENMGYIGYMDSKELQAEASNFNDSVTAEVTDANKAIYQDYIKETGRGWKLGQLPKSGAFYATREIPIYERVFGFYKNLIQIDHPWKIQDETNPDLERYIRLENDPAIGWSVVGSGTQHKYLLYVNNKFPFVHQNFVKLNVGRSYPTFYNMPILQVITQGQGKKEMTDVTFPTGKTKKSSVDIYSRTYLSPSLVDRKLASEFGEGDAYTKTEANYQDPSMIVNSSIIGLIGVAIAYAVALPLGFYMARFKNTFFDSLSTSSLTFLMALPTIAQIYVFRFLMGKFFGLPDVFPTLGASSPLSYISPAILLGLFNIPGLALWVRRYLIDQQMSDYTRFARAKGLTENEIMKRHIFKNAMVPIVSGFPGAIIGVIIGATLTESIFSFPGMGKMLIDAVKSNNSNMVVGLGFIMSSLSILSLLLGDLLMTVVDPRIKLDTKGGK